MQELGWQQEGADGAPRRSAGRSGGAGRLRQDGHACSTPRRGARARSGCSSSRSRSAATSSCGRRSCRRRRPCARGSIARGGSSARWPKTIVPDNMTAIDQDRPTRSSPTLVAAFLDYAQARGIFVDPARVRSPKDKPRVENQVPYVRESWFDGETFTDLDDARESAEHWCARDRRHARARHDAARCRASVFERVEKAAMLAPPTAPFDVPLWADTPRCTPIITSRSRARSTRCRRCYLRKHGARTRRQDDGEDLLRHRAHQDAPAQAAGRALDRHRAITPSAKAAYALRSVDALVAKAKEQGRARRHLRRAPARRAAAVDAHAAGVRAASALREVRRRPRRGGLPERARVRRRRRRAHRADAQDGDEAAAADAAATARSCSSRCRASLGPSEHFETRSTATKKEGRLMATARRPQPRARRRAQAPASSAASPTRCPSGSCSPTSRRCRSTISCCSSSPTRSRVATTPRADNRAQRSRARSRDAPRALGQDVEGHLRQAHARRARRACASSRRIVTSSCSAPSASARRSSRSALGHIACRHGYHVRFARADEMLRTLRQSRLDNSRDAEMIALTTVDLLILDDFALEPMTQGGEQGRLPALPRAHRTRVDDRHQQPRHRASGSRCSTTCCSRRAPSIGSRTPPTTSSSRASRTGRGSSRSSTRQTRPRRPPCRRRKPTPAHDDADPRARPRGTARHRPAARGAGSW